MIYELVIPVLLLAVPWLVTRFILATPASRRMTFRQAAPYMLVVTALWAVGFVLPNVPITNQTDSFSLHTAGGVAAGVLWLYAMRAYRIKFVVWWYAPLSLYLLVSGLGVLNELFEVFLNATGWEHIYNLDAQWDLVANTTGATLVFIGWSLSRPWHSKR